MAFCYFIFFTFLYTRDPCNEEMPRTVIYDRKQNVPQQRVGYFLSSFSNSQICIAWHPNPMIQTSRDEGGKKKTQLPLPRVSVSNDSNQTVLAPWGPSHRLPLPYLLRPPDPKISNGVSPEIRAWRRRAAFPPCLPDPVSRSLCTNLSVFASVPQFC